MLSRSLTLVVRALFTCGRGGGTAVIFAMGAGLADMFAETDLLPSLSATTLTSLLGGVACGLGEAEDLLPLKGGIAETL